jgi:hypothetical protein
MKQVIKGDGSVVPFDREKLVRSMRAAGASEATSEAIARVIELDGESISTHEMRQRVTHELGGLDQVAAVSYDATRRLVARRALEVMPSVARLPTGILTSMRLGQGEAFQLRSAGRVRNVHAELNERTAIGKNEVRLNTNDLEALDVEDGERILLVRQSQGPVPPQGRNGGPTTTDHGEAQGPEPSMPVAGQRGAKESEAGREEGRDQRGPHRGEGQDGPAEGSHRTGHSADPWSEAEQSGSLMTSQRVRVREGITSMGTGEGTRSGLDRPAPNVSAS